jgi:hypothetical protein
VILPYRFVLTNDVILSLDDQAQSDMQRTNEILTASYHRAMPADAVLLTKNRIAFLNEVSGTGDDVAIETLRTNLTNYFNSAIT